MVRVKTWTGNEGPDEEGWRRERVRMVVRVTVGCGREVS